MHFCMHACMNAWMHGCMDACMQHAFMHASVHPCILAFMHAMFVMILGWIFVSGPLATYVATHARQMQIQTTIHDELWFG